MELIINVLKCYLEVFKEFAPIIFPSCIPIFWSYMGSNSIFELSIKDVLLGILFTICFALGGATLLLVGTFICNLDFSF